MYTLFIRNVVGISSLKKTRRRWENNIKMEIKIVIFGVIKTVLILLDRTIAVSVEKSTVYSKPKYRAFHNVLRDYKHL